MNNAIAELCHLISFQNDYVGTIDEQAKMIKHCEDICNNLNEKKNIDKLFDDLIVVGLLDHDERTGKTITFDNERMVLEFPVLCFKGDEHKKTETRITIAPCVGAKTSSRIISSIPNYEGELEDNAISSFFDKGKVLSDKICNVVGKHYYSIVGDVVKETIKDATFGSFDRLEKYNLYIYIIGGSAEAFRLIVECANDKEKMRKIVSDPEIDTSLEILRKVFPGNSEDLRWFKQESVSKSTQELQHAIFGFSGNKSTGNFVGLTHGNPHYVARSLMLGVMADI